MYNWLFCCFVCTLLGYGALVSAEVLNEASQGGASSGGEAEIQGSVPHYVILREGFCWNGSVHEDSLEELREIDCWFISLCTGLLKIVVWGLSTGPSGEHSHEFSSNLTEAFSHLNYILLPASVAITWLTMAVLLQIIIHGKWMKEAQLTRTTEKWLKYEKSMVERCREDDENLPGKPSRVKIANREPRERRFVLQNMGAVTVFNHQPERDAHGVVWRGFLSMLGNEHLRIQVAVKEMKVQSSSVEENCKLTKAICRRIETCRSKCDHSNVIKYYGCESVLVSPYNKLLILMERTDQSLHELIHEDAAFALKCTYHDLLKIFLGIISGVQYLHETMGVIHFNLRPQNIMLLDRKDPKIAGIELALGSLNGSVEIKEIQGCQYYMAPEICLLAGFVREESQKVDTSVDVFSLGVIMWESVMCMRPNLLTEKYFLGKGPFIRMHSGWSSDLIQCYCPEPLRKLIEKCVRFDMEHFMSKSLGDASADYQRPSLQEIAGCIKGMLKKSWVHKKPVGWNARA